MTRTSNIQEAGSNGNFVEVRPAGATVEELARRVAPANPLKFSKKISADFFRASRLKMFHFFLSPTREPLFEKVTHSFFLTFSHFFLLFLTFSHFSSLFLTFSHFFFFPLLFLTLSLFRPPSLVGLPSACRACCCFPSSVVIKHSQQCDQPRIYHSYISNNSCRDGVDKKLR